MASPPLLSILGTHSSNQNIKVGQTPICKEKILTQRDGRLCELSRDVLVH
jgi:hypothetical protein